MGKRIKIEQSFIIETKQVCPYCMNDANDKTGCCGESSAHFETAHVTRDLDVWLDSEIEIVDSE